MDSSSGIVTLDLSVKRMRIKPTHNVHLSTPESLLTIQTEKKVDGASRDTLDHGSNYPYNFAVRPAESFVAVLIVHQKTTLTETRNIFQNHPFSFHSAPIG